jgi:hypothetical protein
LDDPLATRAALSAHLAARRSAWLVDHEYGAAPLGRAAASEGGVITAQYVPLPWQKSEFWIADPDLAAGIEGRVMYLHDPGWDYVSTWPLGWVNSTDIAARYVEDVGSPAVVLGNGRRSAAIGFVADSLTGRDGQRFYENLLDITTKPRPFIQEVQPPSCAAAVGGPVTVTVPATAPDGNLVAASLAWGDGTEDDNARPTHTTPRSVTPTRPRGPTALWQARETPAAPPPRATRSAGCWCMRQSPPSFRASSPPAAPPRWGHR